MSGLPFRLEEALGLVGPSKEEFVVHEKQKSLEHCPTSATTTVVDPTPTSFKSESGGYFQIKTESDPQKRLRSSMEEVRKQTIESEGRSRSNDSEVSMANPDAAESDELPLEEDMPKAKRQRTLQDSVSESSPIHANDSLAVDPSDSYARSESLQWADGILLASCQIIGTPWEMNEDGRRVNKHGVHIKKPRTPTDSIKRFGTDFWETYNTARPNNHATRRKFKKNYTLFEDYKLFTLRCFDEIRRDPQAIPKRGIKLDDFCCAVVGDSFPLTQLGRYWPADFDYNGMIRATRYPVGAAATIEVREGDVDMYGQKIGPGQGGRYYAWYRGLQLLCGDEGKERFHIRPAFEDVVCFGSTWKADYRAGPERK